MYRQPVRFLQMDEVKVGDCEWQSAVVRLLHSNTFAHTALSVRVLGEDRDANAFMLSVIHQSKINFFSSAEHYSTYSRHSTRCKSVGLGACVCLCGVFVCRSFPDACQQNCLTPANTC